MADTDSESQAADTATPDTKSGKAKPTKNLPTDRVGFESQFKILRAYAKASDEQGRVAVTNKDVERFADISASSISTCNPFWNDAGLLLREGNKQRPVEAVFAYDQAAEWGADRPASKLAQVLASSWFGKPLLAKLALQAVSKNEALAFLADECRASPDYKAQVALLLEYLEFVGLIVCEGNLVMKTAMRPAGDSAGGNGTPPPPPPPPTPPPGAGTKQFSIPIPDKEDAVITLPDNLDVDDWAMVQTFLKTYVQHWKKFPKSTPPPTGPGVNAEEQKS